MIDQLKQTRDIVDIAEYINNRLYFVTFRHKRMVKSNVHFHFFNTDEIFLYSNFFADFGPVNIGCVYRFSKILQNKLRSKNLSQSIIVYWTVLDYRKRANAAFLISAFALIHLDFSPKEAVSPLVRSKYPFTPFVDANMVAGIESPYTIRIIDCLNALNRAFYFGLISFNDFDIDEYENFDGANIMTPGDLNWIVPRKLIGFAGPGTKRSAMCPVSYYINYFKRESVLCVIRLNKQSYNPSSFTDHGINHFSLYFQDGSTPSREILDTFFEIVESCPGAVAVHCTAGLGRTGCLIGCYLMKHYRMTYSEAIAWMRLCRPGCIIGRQQSWLEFMQSTMWHSGDEFRIAHNGNPQKMKMHKYGIYSIAAKRTNLKVWGTRMHSYFNESLNQLKYKEIASASYEDLESSAQAQALLQARFSNRNASNIRSKNSTNAHSSNVSIK